MSHAVSAWGSVDPDLVHARLAELEDGDEQAQVRTIVSGGFACLTRIQSINFSALEQVSGSKPPREVWAEVDELVAAMWLAVEDLNTTLKPLIDQHDDRVHDSDSGNDFEFDLVDGESETRAEVTTSSAPLTPLERIGETAWATCFVLNGEVQAFRRRLTNLLKISDSWELVGELQDHVGHVKAAVNAILTGVYSSLPSRGAGSGDPNEADQNLELLAARELRSRIFELRDNILRIEFSMSKFEPGQWEKFLRLAHQMIQQFMFGPGFAWMRAGDKRTFISQHRSLAELLELWSPLRAAPARQTVQNMARYLEALEVINQREILVAHDREKLELVVRHIEAAIVGDEQQRRNATGAALAALAELQGRDKVLDGLLEQTLAPGTPVPAATILKRSSELLSKLSPGSQ